MTVSCEVVAHFSVVIGDCSLCSTIDIIQSRFIGRTIDDVRLTLNCTGAVKGKGATASLDATVHIGA